MTVFVFLISMSFLWANDEEIERITTPPTPQSLPTTKEETLTFICRAIHDEKDKDLFDSFYQSFVIFIEETKDWNSILDHFREIVHCQPFEEHPDFLFILLASQSNILQRARMVEYFLGKPGPSNCKETLYAMPFLGETLIRHIACNIPNTLASSVDLKVREHLQGRNSFPRVFERHMLKQWNVLSP